MYITWYLKEEGMILILLYTFTDFFSAYTFFVNKLMCKVATKKKILYYLF